jgi:hypothetical protein
MIEEGIMQKHNIVTEVKYLKSYLKFYTHLEETNIYLKWTKRIN